jgi:succinate-semialdehyde dehydrogenase/glutarate-semialdehyde dehydrogenase
MNSRLLPTLAGYWDGAFRPLATLPTFDVVDPATTSTLASLPTYSTDHASLAVDAAAGALAQPPSLEQRGKWLLAVERALLDNLTELAQIITAENGKPIAESQGEVRYSAGFFADAANQLTHLDSRDLPITAKDIVGACIIAQRALLGSSHRGTSPWVCWQRNSRVPSQLGAQPSSSRPS